MKKLNQTKPNTIGKRLWWV